MKVIVINGLPRSGKDTFVNYCKNSNAKIYNLSTVTDIKRKAKLIGWDGQKDSRGRRLLSDLKDAMTLYNDSPFQSIVDEVKTHINEENSICFIHCREPEEIERFVNELNAKTLFIRRAAADNVVSNHADERVYDFDYDFVYANDGTLEQLEKDAISFANWLIKE